MSVEPTRMLTGRAVLRVVWLPGSDLLQGTCHCGAVHVAEGPIEVWQWLLGHPIGHTAGDIPAPTAPPGVGAAMTSAGAAR